MSLPLNARPPTLFKQILSFNSSVRLEEIFHYLKDPANGYYLKTEPEFHSIRWLIPLGFHQAIFHRNWQREIKEFLVSEGFPPHGNLIVSWDAPLLQWYYTGDLYQAWAKGWAKTGQGNPDFYLSN